MEARKGWNEVGRAESGAERKRALRETGELTHGIGGLDPKLVSTHHHHSSNNSFRIYIADHWMVSPQSTTMTRFACLLLLYLSFSTLTLAAPNAPRYGHDAHSNPRSHESKPEHKRFKYIRKPPSSPPSTSPPSSTIDKRGIPGIPGDIEYMGFYGSLIAVPTLLSVLGIITNYNLEKSYFNSQLNAQYYRQNREMLKAHAAKLIKDQETKFAKAGYTWNGMIWDGEGKVRPGVRVPSSRGRDISVPQDPKDSKDPKKGEDAGGEGQSGGGGEGDGQTARPGGTGEGQSSVSEEAGGRQSSTSEGADGANNAHCSGTRVDEGRKRGNRSRRCSREANPR